ncbi:MAG: hypothetical protein ACW99U_15715 [Candidatus Thorarchaeota archaeon]
MAFLQHAVTHTFEVIDRLTSGENALAAKHAGVMSHYIVDLAVFGHVMGSSTDWGSEAHHSDYENHIRDATTGYVSGEFDAYLEFDGDLVELGLMMVLWMSLLFPRSGMGVMLKTVCGWMGTMIGRMGSSGMVLGVL